MKFSIITTLATLAAAALQSVGASPVNMSSTNDTTPLFGGPVGNTVVQRSEWHQTRIVIYLCSGRYHIDYVDPTDAGEGGSYILESIQTMCPFAVRDWSFQNTDNVGYMVKFYGQMDTIRTVKAKQDPPDCYIKAIAEALYLDPKNKDELEVQFHC